MIDRDQQERTYIAEQKRLESQLRADAQALMASESSRRVVMQFLDHAGIDASTYRTRPHDMVVAATMRDTAAWWLWLIRTYCPEREAQMRIEWKKHLTPRSTGTEEQDNEVDE